MKFDTCHGAKWMNSDVEINSVPFESSIINNFQKILKDFDIIYLLNTQS